MLPASGALEKSSKNNKAAEKREEITPSPQLASQGQIATVYVQLYESNEDKLVGGVVLKTPYLCLRNGQLTYEEWLFLKI